MWQDKYKESIKDMIRYAVLGYRKGLVVATGGNISTRCADGILITGSGTTFRELKWEDFLLVDLNGLILEGKCGLKPSKETKMHLILYKDLEVSCVFHVHPPHVVAFSCVGIEPPRVTSFAKYKLPPSLLVGVARSGSSELAELIRQAHEKYRTLPGLFILQEHGIIVSGKNACECFNLAEMMEENAKIAYRTLLIRNAQTLKGS